MLENNQKVAVVSGGGTGIGSAVCRRLAADGYSVVVGFSKSEAGARAVVDDIVGLGGQACVFNVDISVEQNVVALFDYCEKSLGRVDVLINNAGVGHQKLFKDISTEDYDRLFNLNTRGTFFMCREAARRIEDNGRIVNVSTGVTHNAKDGMALYVSSKMAIEGFSKVLARELGPRGITVNSVLPGMTDTPMLEGGNAVFLRDYGAKISALGRCGQAQDVADAIASLVSSDGRWITGQTIHVDGGSVIV